MVILSATTRAGGYRHGISLLQHKRIKDVGLGQARSENALPGITLPVSEIQITMSSWVEALPIERGSLRSVAGLAGRGGLSQPGLRPPLRRRGILISCLDQAWPTCRAFAERRRAKAGAEPPHSKWDGDISMLGRSGNPPGKGGFVIIERDSKILQKAFPSSEIWLRMWSWVEAW